MSGTVSCTVHMPVDWSEHTESLALCGMKSELAYMMAWSLSRHTQTPYGDKYDIERLVFKLCPGYGVHGTQRRLKVRHTLYPAHPRCKDV